jgi:hypothetical protein
MEVEENRSLLFIDVRVSRKPDGSLGHTVYRKPMQICTSMQTPNTIRLKRG